jgi:hypothetical protein
VAVTPMPGPAAICLVRSARRSAPTVRTVGALVPAALLGPMMVHAFGGTTPAVSFVRVAAEGGTEPARRVAPGRRPRQREQGGVAGVGAAGVVALGNVRASTNPLLTARLRSVRVPRGPQRPAGLHPGRGIRNQRGAGAPGPQLRLGLELVVARHRAAQRGGVHAQRVDAHLVGAVGRVGCPPGAHLVHEGLGGGLVGDPEGVVRGGVVHVRRRLERLLGAGCGRFPPASACGVPLPSHRQTAFGRPRQRTGGPPGHRSLPVAQKHRVLECRLRHGLVWPGHAIARRCPGQEPTMVLLLPVVNADPAFAPSSVLLSPVVREAPQPTPRLTLDRLRPLTYWGMAIFFWLL